ncbi:MAG: DUF3179 domain-containing protein [Pseudomonadota bacterium]
MTHRLLLAVLLGVLATIAAISTATPSPQGESNAPSAVGTYLEVLTRFTPQDTHAYLDDLEQVWHPGYTPILLELARFANGRVAAVIFERLAQRSGENFGYDMNGWYQWWWNAPDGGELTADYADFKAELYRHIDPKFRTYFRGRQDTARIRLDEIRWGGVVQDGIPPLRDPQMVAAADATYLDADNIVFGIEINGDARAYPKRILAWHEMFTDTVGGVDVAGVYCTLCGTVIPYKTAGHRLGTSGFLYRSNKLMYDQATQSLWNTILGEPVLGPLVGKGIKLEHLSVVTTTWGAWQARHPDTSVLSLDTGHRRDYAEGAAYRQYFGTDVLMFNTPFADDRLQNKQEVLALRLPGAPDDQLAIDTAYLRQHPIYTDRVGFQDVLVFTDHSGANRVYNPQDVSFVAYDGDRIATDSTGVAWRVEEEQLLSQDGRTLDRLPYHRAFWFGWHATFPQTRLVR